MLAANQELFIRALAALLFRAREQPVTSLWRSPRRNMRKADESLHESQLPRVIELESGNAFAGLSCWRSYAGPAMPLSSMMSVDVERPLLFFLCSGPSDPEAPPNLRGFFVLEMAWRAFDRAVRALAAV